MNFQVNALKVLWHHLKNKLHQSLKFLWNPYCYFTAYYETSNAIGQTVLEIKNGAGKQSFSGHYPFEVFSFLCAESYPRNYSTYNSEEGDERLKFQYQSILSVP